MHTHTHTSVRTNHHCKTDIIDIKGITCGFFNHQRVMLGGETTDPEKVLGRA